MKKLNPSLLTVLSLATLTWFSACGQSASDLDCTQEFVTDHNRLGTEALGIQDEKGLVDFEAQLSDFENKYRGVNCRAISMSGPNRRGEAMMVNVDQKVGLYRSIIAEARNPTKRTQDPTQPQTYVLTAQVDAVCSSSFLNERRNAEEAQKRASDFMNQVSFLSEMAEAKAAVSEAEVHVRLFTRNHGTTTCVILATDSSAATKVSGKVLSEAMKKSNEALKAQLDALEKSSSETLIDNVSGI